VDLDAWSPWHPSELAARLNGAPVPWAVAGGWALDVWHGEQTRPHEDIEFAVPRGDFPALRPYFADLELYEALDGEVRPWHGGSRQCWVFDPVARRWRTDIFLEPGDRATWVSHRDPRITRPYAEAVRRAGGIPYLRPESVLFTKAKHCREKDEGDFARALPKLDVPARAWLANVLDLVHPGHLWRARL
jgi:hypothetical protein